MNCDFCNDKVARTPWTFVTLGKIELPEDMAHNVAAWRDPDGFWAACDGCADLIDARDFEGLVEYSFRNPMVEKATGKLFPQSEARWWKERLFREFFKRLVPGGRIHGLPVWAAETQATAKLLASRA